MRTIVIVKLPTEHADKTEICRGEHEGLGRDLHTFHQEQSWVCKCGIPQLTYQETGAGNWANPINMLESYLGRTISLVWRCTPQDWLENAKAATRRQMPVFQFEMFEAPPIEKTFPSKRKPALPEKKRRIQDKFCLYWTLSEISNPILSIDAEQPCK